MTERIKHFRTDNTTVHLKQKQTITHQISGKNTAQWANLALLWLSSNGGLDHDP